jgi:hypothetical protein
MDPDSVLDVGSGFAKFGFLLREFLEVWQGRLHPKEWEKRIDAIEVWKPYTQLPWYPILYNRVVVANVMSRLKLVRSYDLVLMIDLIEHLKKEDGKRLLEAARHWIVATPAYKRPQEARFHNKHERHLSYWGPGNFRQKQIVGAPEQRMTIAWEL